ncbi:MAG: hypothetical protein AAGF12_24655 [Myxococcota bacterium]
MSLTAIELKKAIVERRFPTITTWNRLEGQPRTKTFDRALRSEVRDALWTVTRQWQTGELEGDDAGSVVGAKLHAEVGELAGFSDGTQEEPYSDEVPLEATVERQPVLWTRGGVGLHLDLRLEAGRQLTKLLRKASLGSYVSAYRGRYPFTLPNRDRSPAAAAIYPHPEVEHELRACVGRAIDGGELLRHLQANPAHRASDGLTLDAPQDGPSLDAVGAALLAWFDRLYLQPGQASAWKPESLEHSFQCTVQNGPEHTVLAADEYAGGHLDWYSFDIESNERRTTAKKRTITRSFLPAPLTFDGMPHTRWWKFEDNKVNFAGIRPTTTDLPKLLLMEFGLIYANDWFLLPLKLPTGSHATIRGLTVTNTFGERIWIEPAGKGPEQQWEKFRMFGLSSRSPGQADTGLFVAPAVPKIQNGAPLDEVFLVRDETANMVWGIETRVPLLTGPARNGREAARDVRSYHASQVAAPEAPPDLAADIYYRTMSSVPEHWIPFLPVHTKNSSREIELQRGGMLRLIEGDPEDPVKVEAQTITLRRGLDDVPQTPYFIHEEEVSRAGTRVTRAFQRTRWRDGRTFTWLAMAKETGRGEAESRLAFDDIVARRSLFRRR